MDTDASSGEQKLVVLRGVDPQQREGLYLRRATKGPQDVDHLRGEQHRHSGGLEARCGAVHGYVPAEGFPSLVREWINDE